jgi:hypothetical protein
MHLRYDVECTSGGMQSYEMEPGRSTVRIDRAGNLRVFEGWRRRIFHPAGEWTDLRVRQFVTMAEVEAVQKLLPPEQAL